jgi:hypothetical protein
MVFPLPILLAAVLLVAAPPANRSDELLRAPWTRGSERFERQWLLLGPVPAASSIEPSSAPATPGQPQALSDGRTLRWTSFPSWSNTVDLTTLAESGEALAAYAEATLQRDRAGEAVLSVGSDGGLRVWVNGALVHDRRGPRPFAPDEDRVPVRLVQGQNHLRLRLERGDGPWRFALPVLETGALPAPREEISPSIVASTPQELSLRTHFAPAAGAAPVAV